MSKLTKYAFLKSDFETNIDSVLESKEIALKKKKPMLTTKEKLESSSYPTDREEKYIMRNAGV
ncbi:hypothetical protein ACM6XU_000559 [Vibrio parahaemolyticus]